MRNIFCLALAGSEEELLDQLSLVLAGAETGVYATEIVLQVTQSKHPVPIIRIITQS